MVEEAEERALGRAEKKGQKLRRITKLNETKRIESSRVGWLAQAQ